MKAVLLLLTFGLCNSAITGQSTTQCTAAGKLIVDYECTSYIVCLDLDTGTEFASYSVSCPTGFHVRVTDMACYKGTPCDTTYTCPRVGNVTNPSSTSTTSYISCIQGVGTVIVAAIMECPENSVFDSTTAACLQTVTEATTIATEATTVATAATVADTTAATTAAATVATTAATAAATTAATTAASTAASSQSIFTTTTQPPGPGPASGASHADISYSVILSFAIGLLLCKDKF